MELFLVRILTTTTVYVQLNARKVILAKWKQKLYVVRTKHGRKKRQIAKVNEI